MPNPSPPPVNAWSRWYGSVTIQDLFA